jgi:hypothetical protein
MGEQLMPVRTAVVTQNVPLTSFFAVIQLVVQFLNTLWMYWLSGWHRSVLIRRLHFFYRHTCVVVVMCLCLPCARLDPNTMKWLKWWISWASKVSWKDESRVYFTLLGWMISNVGGYVNTLGTGVMG